MKTDSHTILIVDDDIDLSMVLRSLLTDVA